MNDNDEKIETSAEALAKAERKLLLVQERRVRESVIDAAVSTEPDGHAPHVRTDEK